MTINKDSVPVVEGNGARIPLLGLGTWDLRGRACARVVEQALRLGYRHIDTAEMYDNEREVGEGLRASGIKRDDVFITTKIWPTHFAPPALERAARECLARLRLGAVDLLLLHWPNPQIPIEETLGALVKVKREGLHPRHRRVQLQRGADRGGGTRERGARSSCNQVECHPFLDQSKVIAACRQHGMAVIAYSPIAQRQCAQRRGADADRQGARQKRRASLLALSVQQNIAVIPRTSKVERLTENAAIFDFTLSAQEMAEISGLAHRDGRLLDWSFSGQPKWDSSR